MKKDTQQIIIGMGEQSNLNMHDLENMVKTCNQTGKRDGDFFAQRVNQLAQQMEFTIAEEKMHTQRGDAHHARQARHSAIVLAQNLFTIFSIGKKD